MPGGDHGFHDFPVGHGIEIVAAVIGHHERDGRWRYEAALPAEGFERDHVEGAI